MLIKREQIISSYCHLLKGNSFPKKIIIGEFINDLPPFFCRQLAMGEDLLHCHQSDSLRISGESHALFECQKKNDHKICFLMKSEEFPFSLGLPLNGLITTRQPKKKWKSILNVFDEMFKDDKVRITYILGWTSLIVWVETDPDSFENATLLTSSTFPDLPHTTFISDKGLRHIPPNNIFGSHSKYALKENLFHEALHQEMSALLLHNDILRYDYCASSARKIPVPWRGNAEWEPDRVLHAVFVYSHIIPMRVDYFSTVGKLEPDELIVLEKSISEGVYALKYLSNELSKCEYIFSEQGKKYFRKILNLANSVLKKNYIIVKN